jgi:lia operon protein LiaF
MKGVMKMKRQIWGVVLLLLGILVLLQVIGVYNFGLAFWPVMLLLLGVVIIWESLSFGWTSWVILGLGLWVGAIGLFGILKNAEVLAIGGSEIARYGWPLILVAIGLSILLGDSFKGKHSCWSGKDAENEGWKRCSKLSHIGDLYHGRSPWILDSDQEFHHGIGDVVIDLTTADIRPGLHKILVKVGMGEVTVRVPGGVNLDIHATVRIGELRLFEDERTGISGLDLRRAVEVDGAEATVQLEAILGVGEMEILYLPAITGVVK